MLKIIILSLFLTGCSYDVDSWEFKAANDFCSDKGGVSYMSSYQLSPYWRVICQDSTTTVLVPKGSNR